MDIIKLIQICESDIELGSVLLEGIVDEFIQINGEVKFNYRIDMFDYLRLNKFRFRYSPNVLDLKNCNCTICIRYQHKYHSNPLFKFRYDKAGYFPKKGSYVDLIRFKSNEPEKMLKYLHYMIENGYLK